MNSTPQYYQFWRVDPKADPATDNYIAQKRAWILSILAEFAAWEGYETYYTMLAGFPPVNPCPCELVRHDADLRGCTQGRRVGCSGNAFGGFPFPSRTFQKMEEELGWRDRVFRKALDDRKSLNEAMQATPTPPRAYPVGGRAAPSGCEAIEAAFLSRLWAAELAMEAFPDRTDEAGPF